ncbi:MAG: undecaprenyl-phosphate glucose phosphotransferase, partial [Paludibacter sp.]|nr:undecaprenyl-phosphate glucose phosphotransferase [Paludibacter sp.]
MESNEAELKFLYLTFDIIILNVAIFLMYFVGSQFFSYINIHDKSLYLLLSNLSYVITYSIFSVKNLYMHDDFSIRIRRITNRIFIFSVISFIFAHLFLAGQFSNLFILGCLFFFYLGEIIYYFALYSYLKYRRTQGYFIHRVLIVGLNDMSVFLHKLINNNPLLGYEFIGYVSENSENNQEVVGDLDDLVSLVSIHQIDFLFVTHSAYNDLNKSKELLATCNRIGVRLRFVPENQYWFKTKMNMESVGSLVVFNPQEIP